MASLPALAIPPGFRNPIIHDSGPSSYPGAYQITEEALKNYGVARDLFGTTEVVIPGVTSFRVKDCQYRLADGSVGMTFLPVSDTGASKAPDGNMIFGSTLVDEFLRVEMKLKPEDQIFCFMYFIHPELNRGSIMEFALNDKVQLGITHMGAYHGGGRTTNSPPLYHNRGWGVKAEVNKEFGYPANVAILRMENTDQAMLNKNLALVDNILNYGVRFPRNYLNSQFRQVDINTTLMFYRDWILQKHYLRTDETWFTFCAAHKAIVANVGLNLPHNREAFVAVYGAIEGSEFFNIFCDFHFEVFGTKFTEEFQTDFEPLWKKENLTTDQIKPFTLSEYNDYEAARRSGSLDSFTGFKPVSSDIATVWAPQMTADLVFDFVQNYANFIDAGAVVMVATLVGLAGTVSQRMDIPRLDYLVGVIPIAQLAMLADARMKAAAQPALRYQDSAYFNATFAGLYAALGGKDTDIKAVLERVHDWPEPKDMLAIIKAIIAGTVPPEVIAWMALDKVRADWDTLMANGLVAQATAYVDFMEAAAEQFNADRNVVVTSLAGIQFNMPPAMAHMICVGMYPCNPKVSFTPVVTVMNYTELESRALP